MKLSVCDACKKYELRDDKQMPALAKAGILAGLSPITGDFTCDLGGDLCGDCSSQILDHFRDATKMIVGFGHHPLLKHLFGGGVKRRKH